MVGPEHQGQYARVSGAFASGNKKRKTDELRVTQLQTTHAEECQKMIRLSEPSPPTPTKEHTFGLCMVPDLFVPSSICQTS
jgi:hypothetical protein